MDQVDDAGQGSIQNVSGAPTSDVDDEADAAGIALVGWVVEGGSPERFMGAGHRRSFLSPPMVQRLGPGDQSDRISFAAEGHTISVIGPAGTREWINWSDGAR